MSRETDNSSSGPQGSGNAAYPPGSTPYGTPAQGAATGAGADAERQAAGTNPAGAGTSGTPASERRTETTLTTRVRINIPGSRPIPPVVMRTPMSDLHPPGAAAGTSDVARGAQGAAPRPESTQGSAGTGAAAAAPGTDPAVEGAQAQERTSDWFAPPPRRTGPTGTSWGGTGAPGTAGDPAAPGGPGDAFPAGDGGTGFGAGARPGGDSAAGAGFGSGAGTGTTPSGLPVRDTDHRQGAFGATGDAFADHLDDPGRTGYGQIAGHPGSGLPPGAGQPGSPVAPGGPDDHGPAGPGAGRSALYDLLDGPPPGGPGSAPGAQGPSGVPEPDGLGAGQAGGACDVSAPLATGPLGAARGPRDSDLDYFREDHGGEGPPGPAGPTGGPVTGDSVLPTRHRTVPAGEPVGHPPVDRDLAGPPPRMSDDTAILTPQKPAPGPTAPEGNVSGHTVTSGIPVVPAGAQSSPFGGPGASTGPAEGARTHTPPKLPDSSRRSTPAPQPRKKGGSKLVLLTVLLFLLAGGLYGAGLLANHSDVPKGTTVLGVDIGGGTRDDAVKKLDAAFGERTGRTLELSIDGRTVPLRPDQAGLALDSDATVRAAAQNDYNPLTVVGSLFGGTRIVQPVMPVDEEKLRAALDHASGDAGTVTEGTIRFEPGKAVAVYGRAGKGVDAAGSTDTVQQAYRVQVEKGHADPVQVPLTERRPTVSDEEVDRMMKQFAELAMSANVTVKAGSAAIEFGPNRSLPQILGVQAVDGKLVDTYDRAAAQRLYGSTFDGILITRANGKKTPVQPEDVLGAMRKALLGKTPAERIGVIELDPS